MPGEFSMKLTDRLSVPARFAAALLTAVALFPAAVSADDVRSAITFSGLSSRSVVVEGSRSVVLSGEAWIETGTARISAGEITLSGDNYRFADCRGTVVVIDTQQDITLHTSRLEYDRVTSTAVSRGWTEMEDRGSGLIARGGYVKNSGDEGVTIIQIAARVLKDTDDGPMLCRADSIRYDSKAQTVELTGNSVVIWNSDEYRAARITIDLETNDIILEGDVTGKIYE